MGFRENQREIINATKSGWDVIALISTGGGKSLTFQIPAATESGISIVIMPLLSLIADQIRQMREIGVPCIFIERSDDIKRVRRELERGELQTKLLFFTPEKLCKSKGVRDLMKDLYDRKLLERFVIDEAHCVVHFGMDFRPDYLELKCWREEYPGVPILGLTATATPRVMADIAKILNMYNTQFFQSSFNRPNLFYEVVQKKRNTMTSEIAEFIKCRNDNESGIIYCLTK